MTVSPGPYKKILAIKLRALGDTVIFTASLRALIEKFPGARVDALVPEAYVEVLRDFPGLGRVRAWPRENGWIGKLRPFVSLLPQLRAENYDCVVNFHASPRSAQFARLLGARTRAIHFHGHRDINRFSTVLIPGKGMVKPIIERDLDCVRALGAEILPGSARTFVVRTRATQQPPLLVISPGASRPTKMWALDSFVEVARRWTALGGEAIFLLGPAEADLDKRISTTARTVISRSLAESIALLSSATVFAGNDSGPKHLAVALGVPTVTVFGPEDPFEWHPYSRQEHPILFRAGLSCRVSGDMDKPGWCAIPVCHAEGHRCMNDISVDEVFAQILPFAPRTEGA